MVSKISAGQGATAMTARGALLVFGAAVTALSSPAATQAPRPSDEATAQWLTQAIRYVNGEFSRIEQLPNPTCDQTTVALVSLMTYFRGRQDLFPEALVKGWEERVDKISRANCTGAEDHQGQIAQQSPSPSSPGQQQLDALLAEAKAANAAHLEASLRCDREAMAVASMRVSRALNRVGDIVEAAKQAGEFSTVPLAEAQTVYANILSPIWGAVLIRKPQNCPETTQQQPQTSPPQPQPYPQAPQPEPLSAPPRESSNWEHNMRMKQHRSERVELHSQMLEAARERGDCAQISFQARVVEQYIRLAEESGYHFPEQIREWRERLERARAEPCPPRNVQQQSTNPLPRALNPLNILGGGAEQGASGDNSGNRTGNRVVDGLNIFGGATRKPESTSNAPNANEPRRGQVENRPQKKAPARPQRQKRRDQCDGKEAEASTDCPKQ